MISKADTHVHTYFSGTTNYRILRFPESVASPEQQVDCARKHGMSVVCITDHSEIKGAFRAERYGRTLKDIDVVVGDEVMTSDGEIIGLWLNEFIRPGMSAEETIDEIRSQGGIAIAPHPFGFYVRCVGHKVTELDLDGIETINGGHVDGWTNNMAKGCFRSNTGRWAEIGASDAHSTYTMGYTWTEFPGEGEEDLRRAILSKKTVACGRPAPVFTQSQWSLQVVLDGMRMILDRWRGRLDPADDNPLVQKTLNLTPAKQAAALIGGAIYSTPPIPFIGAWAATTWIDRQVKRMKADMGGSYGYKV